MSVGTLDVVKCLVPGTKLGPALAAPGHEACLVQTGRIGNRPDRGCPGLDSVDSGNRHLGPACDAPRTSAAVADADDEPDDEPETNGDDGQDQMQDVIDPRLLKEGLPPADWAVRRCLLDPTPKPPAYARMSLPRLDPGWVTRSGARRKGLAGTPLLVAVSKLSGGLVKRLSNPRQVGKRRVSDVVSGYPDQGIPRLRCVVEVTLRGYRV